MSFPFVEFDREAIPLFRMRREWILVFSFMIGTVVMGQSYVNYSREGLPGNLFDPPADPNDSSLRPLILALHGGGGIGSDNTRYLVDFSGLRLEAAQRNALLYLPQATTAFWHLNNRPTMIMEMIDRAIEERNVDPQRIYVTGFSMGGGGAWDMINLFPDRFAAAIPIAGIRPRTAMNYETLLAKPIWAFHARDDNVVGVTQTRNEVNQLVMVANQPAIIYPAAGNRTATLNHIDDEHSLRYREFPTGGHSIWFGVFSLDEAIDWMFSHSLNESSTTVDVQIEQIEFANDQLVFSVRSTESINAYIQESDTLEDWRNLVPLENLEKDVIREADVELSKSASYFRVVVP